MKRILPSLFLLATGLAALAQSPQAPAPPAAPAQAAAKPAGVPLTLKDGKTLFAAALKRDGNKVMVTMLMPSSPASGASDPAAAPPTAMVQIGYPVDSITKIDFPEPAQLKTAPELLLHGKGTEALLQIEPIAQYYEPFRDIPGNRWTQAAMLKLSALLALQRDKEAEALIGQLSQSSKNPEAVLSARVQMAVIRTRKKDFEPALAVFETAIKESTAPETLAHAWLNKGHISLERGAFEPALISYLRIPVMYPDQQLLLPQAMLGSARAYRGLDDKTHAKRAFEDVVAMYPDTPEAAAAKTELTKLNPSNSKP